MQNLFEMEKPIRLLKPPLISGNQINWNQVFYFCQIAIHGSIKGAADHLGLSPSTLSEHLTQLEKDLNVELFQRQHRSISLTAQGSRLFLHAKEMFEVGQRLIDVVSPIPLGCYPVSVGIVPSTSAWLAYQVLDKYLGSSVPISMKVFQTDHDGLEKGLADAKYDFGFSDRGSDRKDIYPELIFSSHLKFYVAKKWESQNAADLFQKLPILYFNSNSTTRGFVEHLLNELDINPPESVTSEFPGLLFELCESGRGIGVFNEESVKRMQSKISPLRLPKNSIQIQDRLYVLWSKGAENTNAIGTLRKLLPAKV